jgi:hypothetical protein
MSKTLHKDCFTLANVQIAELVFMLSCITLTVHLQVPILDQITRANKFLQLTRFE